MGYGEVEGNGSVHWQVVHEDNLGGEKPLNCRPGNPHRPNADDDVNIKNRARGRDGIKADEIGKSKGHTKKFRVKLRFESQTEAQNVAKALTPVYDSGMWTLILDVPAIPRANPDDPPTVSEVRVDW